MSTADGWGYFKSKNDAAFLSVQELFEGTAVASAPLEDIRGLSAIKRSLHNLIAGKSW